MVKTIKVRTNEQLHERVKLEAEKFDMSMNQFVELVLAARYDERQKNILDTFEEMLGESAKMSIITLSH